MRIVDRIIGHFRCKSTKSAYYAAMHDIREYKQSLIAYRVVAPTKNNEIISENYVGGNKNQHIEEFKSLHPEAYTSYIKAFTDKEAEKYFEYMNLLDAVVLRLERRHGR